MDRKVRDTLRVTLVAAEGGGLRSAYWTYAVLRQIQNENPAVKRTAGLGIGTARGRNQGAADACQPPGITGLTMTGAVAGPLSRVRLPSGLS